MFPSQRLAAGLLILSVAVLALSGCKKPELGFTPKTFDNTMESFLPGYWKSNDGARYEMTEDEFVTVDYKTSADPTKPVDPSKPGTGQFTLHAGGTYKVNGNKITITYASTEPRTEWRDSGEFEGDRQKLKATAIKILPLDKPHTGTIVWHGLDHVSFIMDADATTPQKTIELTRLPRI